MQARRVQVQVRRFISAGGELNGAQVDRAHLLASQFLLRPLGARRLAARSCPAVIFRRGYMKTDGKRRPLPQPTHSGTISCYNKTQTTFAKQLLAAKTSLQSGEGRAEADGGGGGGGGGKEERSYDAHRGFTY